MGTMGDCPPSSVLERHDFDADHGDICRAKGDLMQWSCPGRCVEAPGRQAPYCLARHPPGKACRLPAFFFDWSSSPKVDALVTTLYKPAAAQHHDDPHTQETLAAVLLNANSSGIASVHVLYEDSSGGADGCAELSATFASAGVNLSTLVCVGVRTQPTYFDLLSYCNSALPGRLVILANPDVVFDEFDLSAHVQPRRFDNETLYVFSVRRAPAQLLELTGAADQDLGSPPASTIARCQADTVDRCMEWCTKFTEWPLSWDAFMFRPRRLTVNVVLHFPMNVIGAENYALRSMAALGYRHVRNACEVIRVYDIHCAPKTHGASGGSNGWHKLVVYTDTALAQLSKGPPAVDPELVLSLREGKEDLHPNVVRRIMRMVHEAPPKCAPADCPGLRVAHAPVGRAQVVSAAQEFICSKELGHDMQASAAAEGSEWQTRPSHDPIEQPHWDQLASEHAGYGLLWKASKPPRKSKDRPLHVALVMPIAVCRQRPSPSGCANRLVKSISSWPKAGEGPACRAAAAPHDRVQAGTSGGSLSLALYFASAPNKKTTLAAAALRAAIRPMQPCFTGVKVLHADLSPLEDVPMTGPSEMWFRLFARNLLRGHDAFFWWHHDLLPIRPLWLDELLLEAQRAGHFWVRGGGLSTDLLDPYLVGKVKRSMPVYDYRCYYSLLSTFVGENHINGAALYNLRDQRFVDAAAAARARGDVAIFAHLTNLLEPARVRETAPMIQHTGFVRVLTSPSGDPVVDRRFKRTHPTTFVVYTLNRSGVMGNAISQC
jgi:hypothetical protein